MHVELSNIAGNMMEVDEQSKLLFVINPVSGGNEKTLWVNGIHQYFENSPGCFRIFFLTGKNDAKAVTEHISSFQPDKVIAVGGDGTIKLVAEQLIGSNLPLGILPAGSSNGLANDLNLPFAISEALDVVVHGVITKVDLLLLNDKEVSVHLCDIGMNALFIKYYAMNRERGKWGYAKAFFRVFWQRKIIKTEILIEGITILRWVYMVVLANARSYGSGALINPLGDVSDGKFEVVIFKELSVWELLKMLFTHKPFDPEKIEILQTNEVTLTTRKKVHFQIDGECRGKVNTVKAKILPGALNLLLPE
ncbi:MAG: diacylglycerol kinase family lipid kinase [Chitinophagaceae bacterium]|nr:diacylglycerol kinase family lipid kinase [Chitinophagaceae bacterium]MDP1762673.1 diacylglycerol kinase family protein [Sediminibacterium sp.]MDP1810114.1 diacylglycerol kinase family protein [Sediminibacterium sp.]MDP3127820.1 diacylglycerol kinase family protein [Sediminibacterium sp.]MDP3667309.1 diacylglycerol kinase family protein [Sediminibacterium sp.]